MLLTKRGCSNFSLVFNACHHFFIQFFISFFFNFFHFCYFFYFFGCFGLKIVFMEAMLWDANHKFLNSNNQKYAEYCFLSPYQVTGYIIKEWCIGNKIWKYHTFKWHFRGLNSKDEVIWSGYMVSIDSKSRYMGFKLKLKS